MGIAQKALDSVGGNVGIALVLVIFALVVGVNVMFWFERLRLPKVHACGNCGRANQVRRAGDHCSQCLNEEAGRW